MICPTRLVDFGLDRCAACKNLLYNAPPYGGPYNCLSCGLPHIAVRRDIMPRRHLRVVSSAFVNYLEGIAKTVNDDNDKEIYLTEEIDIEILNIKSSLDKLYQMVPELSDE